MKRAEAKARLGCRLTRREAERLNRSTSEPGWAERCRKCRRFYIQRIRYEWDSGSFAGYAFRAGARIIRQKQCNVCRDKVRSARWARARQARSAKREELRRTRCTRCGRLMAAARSTKRYCSAECRVKAHRNAKGTRVDVSPQPLPSP